MIAIVKASASAPAERNTAQASGSIAGPVPIPPTIAPVIRLSKPFACQRSRPLLFVASGGCPWDRQQRLGVPAAFRPAYPAPLVSSAFVKTVFWPIAAGRLIWPLPNNCSPSRRNLLNVTSHIIGLKQKAKAIGAAWLTIGVLLASMTATAATE